MSRRCGKCGTTVDDGRFFCSKCGALLPSAPSFLALERELSNNTLFTAWKNNSIFEQWFDAPAILYQEFSKEWVANVKTLLGDGPLATRYLALLGVYLENIHSWDGYDRIRRRLEKQDEMFFPTLSEMEFIDLFLSASEITEDRIHLEYTFETGGGKHPELMVEVDSKELYFEVTRIMDYKEMKNITEIHNMVASLLLSLNTLEKIVIDTEIIFNRLPDIDITKNLLSDLNCIAKELIHNQIFEYPHSFSNSNYTIIIRNGDSMSLTLPTKFIENKVKDKLEQETRQFDKGCWNFVVLDTTSISLDMEELSKIVRDYFEYSGDQTISGVFLFSKKWTIQNNDLEYQYHLLHQPRPSDSHRVGEIIEKVFSTRRNET